MKHSLLVIVAAVLFAGCNSFRSAAVSSQQNDTTAPTPERVAAATEGAPSYTAVTPADAEAQKIVGSYVGPFGDNKITMMITKVAGTTISGRSIVAGNDRPFDGTFTVDKAVYTAMAKEPGDDKHDGVFKFTVSSADPSKVTGTFKSNDTKFPEKSFTLERRKFQYRPDVGYWPQGSTRLLKTKEVENLNKTELQMMRQEIFARHGYCFSKKEFRQRFENEDWYVPDTVDIRGRLTDIEKKNIALIKRYEKYAEDYGDEFGR